MIQISSLTNAMSNAVFYTKNVCVNSKVDRVFHATVGAIQAHPYIALLGTSIGVYCCRGQIKSLVNKVIQAAHCLCAKTIETLKNITNLFKQSPSNTSLQPAPDGLNSVPSRDLETADYKN